MNLDFWFTIITPLSILLATLILVWLFRRSYFRLLHLRATHDEYDPTNYKFLGHLLTALFYIIGFSFAIYTFPPLRTLATSLLAGAGILAVAVGFASQAALSNIVSGLFIVIFKPFRVNDRVMIRDTLSGIVEDITLRHTVIRNFENRRIVVPNSIISNEVLTNSDFGETKVCRFLEFTIALDSNVDKAKEIVSSQIRVHEFYFDNRTQEEKENGTPEVTVRVINIDANGVRIRGWAWAENSPKSFVMFCDLLESIKKAFDAEGIEIAYPHRVTIAKNISQ